MKHRELLSEITNTSVLCPEMALEAIFEAINNTREELKSDEREEAVSAEQSA